ncbi:unnamed protein product, partial [Schistosoma margrebowiei]|uniref:Uncharacterized protein n=1 Tax=Schistosoma margrebowiei TaxID=48269 RepID=A0AA84ZTH0_9TREM
MRHNILTAQWMSFFLIIISLTEFYKCQDRCKQLEWKTNEKLIFENISYHYSQHYMYLQRISFNQSQPAVNPNSNKSNKSSKSIPKLSLKYYSSQVTRLDVYPDGGIDIFGGNHLGFIQACSAKKIYSEFAILNEEELFAVRWFINKEVYGK